MKLYELTRGFAYRRIRHPQMHWYAWTLPIAATAVVMATLYVLPVFPKMLGSDGTLAATLSIVSTLPGFYFAGLAAVATFPGLNMDRAMPFPAPILAITVAGVKADVELSRRQFLSYLFSYLVLLSFILCAAIVSLNAISASIAHLKIGVLAWENGEHYWFWFKFAVVGAITWIASNIVTATLQGMFFLSERIHQP